MTLEEKYEKLLDFCVDMSWPVMNMNDIDAILKKDPGNIRENKFVKAKKAKLARVILKEIGELE